MASKMGSFRHTFAERSKERLLSQRALYPEFGFGSMEDLDGERGGCFCSMGASIKSTWKIFKDFLIKAWEFGRKDPRKIIFSAKMGLALVIIAVLILSRVPFKDLGRYSVWALLTVVVVFEFSIGATLSKGFNRALGTLSAGGLALGIAQLCTMAGPSEETLIVISIFVIGCVNGYLQCVEYERVPSKILTYQASDDPVYSGYRSAVESAGQEDTLVGFAIWEPPHGPYRKFSYPWKNYTKLSGSLRHCAFMVMALHGCILSEIQAPAERRKVFSSELQRVGTAGAKVLRELGNKVKKMEKLDAGDLLLEIHEAAEELQTKIDKRSYLLVNAECWEIGTRPLVLEDLKEAMNFEDRSSKATAFKSRSEAVLDLSSVPFSRSWDVRAPVTEIHPSHLVGGSSPEQDLKKQASWPAHLSFHNTVPIEESKTYESASALSLATFSSLLIEFVARLQNVVDAFEELGEVANFSEPSTETSVAGEAKVGMWRRLSRWLMFKD